MKKNNRMTTKRANKRFERTAFACQKMCDKKKLDTETCTTEHIRRWIYV